MTNKDVVNLKWNVRSGIDPHIQYWREEYIMTILFNYENDFHLIMIKDKEGIFCNIWEDSPTLFYGLLKTSDELKNIMRYIGVIDY